MAAEEIPQQPNLEDLPKFDEKSNMPADPEKLIEESKKPIEPLANEEIDPKEALGGGSGGKKSKFAGVAGLSGYLKGGGIAKKLAIVMVGLIAVLSILSVIVSFMRPGEAVPVATPIPTPNVVKTPSPEPDTGEVLLNPSAYAQDPDVLELLDEVSEMDLVLLDVNFKNNLIRVPGLEWDVDFD